jgi:hypothetical protein
VNVIVLVERRRKMSEHRMVFMASCQRPDGTQSTGQRIPSFSPLPQIAG